MAGAAGAVIPAAASPSRLDGDAGWCRVTSPRGKDSPLISKHLTHVVCTAVTAAGLLMTGLAGPASAASTGGPSIGRPKAGSPAKFTTFPDRLYSVAATDANNVWA